MALATVALAWGVSILTTLEGFTFYEALHLCMVMRGIQKQHSVTTTSAFTGGFMNQDKTRKEFLDLIGQKLH